MDSLKDLKTVPITSSSMVSHRKFMEDLRIRLLKMNFPEDKLGWLSVSRKGKV